MAAKVINNNGTKIKIYALCNGDFFELNDELYIVLDDTYGKGEKIKTLNFNRHVLCRFDANVLVKPIDEDTVTITY